MTRPARQLPTLTLLLAVFLLGALVRFYKLDERGLDGSDNVYYTRIAKAWSEGDQIFRVAGEVLAYRPVVYFLYAASIRVFGFNDTSIKLVNATADSINIVLIFTICLLLAQKDPWPAAAASLIYAWSPIAIGMARIELTHTLSTLMVLLAMLFFMLHYAATGVWHRRLHLALAGVLTGWAVLCHEELILTAPGYVLFLLAAFLRSNRSRADAESLAVNLSIFSGAVLFTCRNAIPLLMHYSLVRLPLTPRDAPAHIPAHIPVLSDVERTARLLWNAVIVYGSVPFLVVFIPLLVVIATSGLLALLSPKRPSFPALLYLPVVVLIGYMAGFAKFISLFFPRFFLPLFPLLVVTVVAWSYRLLLRSAVSIVACRGSVAAFALIAVVFNLGNYELSPAYHQRHFADSWVSALKPLRASPEAGYRRLTWHFRKSWARRIYERLEGKVDKDSKLLVAASILFPFPARHILQIGYYFGDNAVYLVDHKEPLDELISRYNIKYVLLTVRMTREEWIGRKTYTRYVYGGKWVFNEPLELGASCGFEPGEYTLRREWECLTAYFEKRGAKLLFGRSKRRKSVEQTDNWKPGDLIYEL